MAVFVLDKHHQPLMPCTEKRARLLLKRRKARIHSMYPFTIRLVHRTIQESATQPLRCKIDPGSRVTGIAIVREDAQQQVVSSLMELTHRGEVIRDALQARAGKRSRRRFNLRYRAPRFANRARSPGWLPPSLRHRVETTLTWINRFSKRAPITAITCERVRFDTQKLISPEIQNIEYSQGTLLGYEIREYLLEKYGRKCVYCNIQNVPLQIDHITPKSCGGSNRIDNLASGYFNIQTANAVIQGIKSQDCSLVQHADGYRYLSNLSTHLTNNTKEQRFLPALKSQVSALSTG
jgi:5-methylcytosine-specific restriction endonuclease McrA